MVATNRSYEGGTGHSTWFEQQLDSADETNQLIAETIERLKLSKLELVARIKQVERELESAKREVHRLREENRTSDKRTWTGLDTYIYKKADFNTCGYSPIDTSYGEVDVK